MKQAVGLMANKTALANSLYRVLVDSDIICFTAREEFCA
jgi:hypothetical protein